MSTAPAANEKAFWKDALGRAAEGHSLATRLYATAQRILSNWEADNGLVCATMRERAYRELQVEKDQKSRNKTITDKDVEAVMAAKYPDEYTELELRRLKARKMVEAMSDLHERAAARARNLDTMTQGARG